MRRLLKYLGYLTLLFSVFFNFSTKDARTVFVSNLLYSVDEDRLRERFSQVFMVLYYYFVISYWLVFIVLVSVLFAILNCHHFCCYCLLFVIGDLDLVLIFIFILVPLLLLLLLLLLPLAPCPLPLALPLPLPLLFNLTL